MGDPNSDTICAIATPMGEGGIGIVRISGAKSIELASTLVRLRSGTPLESIAGRTLHHADILEIGTGPDDAGRRAIDEALVVVMRAPHSYTAEDIVEIQCHGSPLVLQTLCEALLHVGARMAEPGEFTKRAFLNGRLDLAQAEAVLDTIRAKTAGSLRVAQEQLRGTLSHELGRLRDGLIRILAQVEASIDFVEEDISFISSAELRKGIEAIRTAIRGLIETSREGRALREGVATAIVGRPNVGKSSLLNALLRTDRAIVTPVPGTTRDVLEEILNIRGVPVRLLDTAGLRHTDDPVEREGITRSQAALDTADLALLVLDGSAPLGAEDRHLLAECRGRQRIIVINKTDLPARVSAADLADFEESGRSACVHLSVKTGEGLETLRDTVRAMILRPDFEPGEAAMVTRLRHRAGLLKAEDALEKALESVTGQVSLEFIAMDLRGAIDALGEITGAVTVDDILDRIFSEFCIGK